MKSYCSECSHATNQEVLYEHLVAYEDYDIAWWQESKYQIIICKGCDTVSYRSLYNDATMQMFQEGDASTQLLYPQRDRHTRVTKKYEGVPLYIREVYDEAVVAYNNKLRILCVTGLRAILDGVCADKQIIGGNATKSDGSVKYSSSLEGKLYGLAESGYLPHENAEVLHQLRFMGNEAVHALVAPPMHDLKTAIEIVEHVLDHVYEVKHKGAKLTRSRRSSDH